MAFPSVRSSVVTDGGTASATPVINLPPTIGGGDVILVVFRVAVAGAIGWPAAWNELFDLSSDAADDQMAAAWHWASGDEGGTTITLSCTSGKFAAVAYAISGTQDPRVRPPELSTAATGASANPNATTCTPTGGAKDYLWLTFTGREGEATLPPTYPTNYTVSQLTATSGTGGVVTTNVRVSAAVRTNNNAASEDAGQWAFSDTEDWTAYTIAFHPNVEVPRELVAGGVSSGSNTLTRAARNLTRAACFVAPNLLLATLGVMDPPFIQSDWPDPPPKPRALVTTINTRPSEDATVPFDLTDWPTVQRTPFYVGKVAFTFGPPPNTLDVPVVLPFNQAQWAPPQRTKPTWDESSPSLLLTTLAPAAAPPFNQVFWPRPQRSQPLAFVGLVSTPPAEEVAPPPPFIPIDWPKPKIRILWPITTINTRSAVDSTAPLTPSGWPRPVFVRGRRLGSQPPNLLTSTLSVVAAEQPFALRDWPATPRIKPRPLSWVAYVIIDDSVPFIPLDWPKPQLKVERRDRTWGANLLQSSLQPAAVAPFAIPDWPQPQRKVERRDQSYGVNLVLGRVAEVVPIGRAGLSIPGFRRQPPPFDWTPNLPLLQNVGVTPPFIPVEWPKPQRSKPQPAPFDWAPNTVLIQVAEALPIGRAVTSLPTLRLGSQSWAQNLLQFTLSDVVIPPFIPVEWPAPSRRLPLRLTDVRGLTLAALDERPFSLGVWSRPVSSLTPRQTDVTGLTLAVLEQRPFSLTEWPPTARRSTRASDVQLPLVLTTLQVLPLPFNQSEWPKPAPKRLQPKYYELPNNVLRQIREALPFNQSDWPQPVWIRWESSNRGTTEEGIIRITSLSVINAYTDVVIQVQPEGTWIQVRPEGTWIQVRPDAPDVEIL